MSPPRRVISGLDAEGRSCIIIDGPASTMIWSTDGAVADNSGTADAGGGGFGFPTSGTVFIYSDFPPGTEAPMHATDTIDYIVILSGEVVFVTETGEAVLRAGDFLVDRGVIHSWRNDGDTPCRIVSVLAAALPLGEGATMSGTIEKIRHEVRPGFEPSN